jgi:hypothetical protein
LGSWKRDRTAIDDGFLKAQDRSLDFYLGKMPQNGNGQAGV